MQECFGAHEVAVRQNRMLVTRTRHVPTLRTPAHAHPVMCLHFVVRGQYDEHTRAGHHRVDPGWVLFKPSGEVHWNEFRGPGAETLRIELDPEALPDLTRRLPGRLTALRSPQLAALARRAHRELGAVDDLTPIVAESLALEIFALVARQPAGGESGSGSLARRCAELLDVRFTRSYRLGDAAHELGVDRTALARAFRREFGCTVGEFIRARRIEYVAARLTDGSHRSLGRLAIEAGFADQSHMTRTFRSVYGCTPGTWRGDLAPRH